MKLAWVVVNNPIGLAWQPVFLELAVAATVINADLTARYNSALQLTCPKHIKGVHIHYA
jgi:hypothetical protein